MNLINLAERFRFALFRKRQNTDIKDPHAKDCRPRKPCVGLDREKDPGYGSLSAQVR